MKPHIFVACGVLRDATGRVLIVERPPGKIAAFKWEFPGGKIEPGETPRQALDRELHEEIGIVVRQARPLALFTHEYAERKVTLHTFLVTGWDGEPHPHEGQRFDWHRPGAALTLDVLPTVAPILRALGLPEDYVFTPTDLPAESLLAGLERLPCGSLLRLRRPGLPHAAYQDLACKLIEAAQPRGLRVILDRGEPMARWLGAAGVHFTQAALMQLQPDQLTRTPGESLLRLASCHDSASLQQAERLELDAVVIGQVNATATHPDRAGQGWAGFAALAAQSALPAYAIGGLGPQDKPDAFAHCAQGVAGISAYWSRS